MKRLIVGAVLTGVAFANLRCAGDPNASLRNGPASLNPTPRQIFIDSGSPATDLVVTARDGQLNPVAVVVTATSSAPAVAKVAPDSSRPIVDSSTYPFTVTPGNVGRSRITLTGGGVTDSSSVIVLPVVFTGAISDTAPAANAPVTIHGTSALKFDPAKDTVYFGTTPTPGLLAVNTADSLVVLTPFSTRAPLTITGIQAAPGLDLTLFTVLEVHQTGGDPFPGDSSWQTAPDITGLLPASGKTSYFIATPAATADTLICPEAVLGFGSSGPCMMFKFTVATPTTLSFTTDWIGGAAAPDVDVYSCSDSTVANFGAACFEDGGNGATGAKPQSTGNFTYPPGTHYYVIENYAGTASKNLYTTISAP
ncbi:MAG TPA: hypothetical protein VLV45_05180 [Gemmatimonadales bacterium]|nr:hypothetical protein [Gemmatimonadales bacterium]